ncbi:MAG: hypothetical protein RL693_1466 [Verrucomicrobiota bacterium]|jgi:hypothetical protein
MAPFMMHLAAESRIRPAQREVGSKAWKQILESKLVIMKILEDMYKYSHE